MIITRKYSSASNLYSVKSFGAKGDGLTDDTNYVQAAITAMEAAVSPGGILYFPKGSYLLRGTAEWRSIKVNAGNVTIRGDGIGLSRLVQADAQYPVIGIGADANAVGSVLIEHLGFIAAESLTDDGQDLEEAKGSLLSVIGDEDNMIRSLTVRDCLFENGMRRCIYLKNIKIASINECQMQAGDDQDHITAVKPANSGVSWHLYVGSNIYLDEDDQPRSRVLDPAFGSGSGTVVVHGTADSEGAPTANFYSTLALAKASSVLYVTLDAPDSNGTGKQWVLDNDYDTATGVEDVDWFTTGGGDIYRVF